MGAGAAVSNEGLNGRVPARLKDHSQLINNIVGSDNPGSTVIRDDGKVYGVFELRLIGVNKYGHILLSSAVHVYDIGQAADAEVVADAAVFRLKDGLGDV